MTGDDTAFDEAVPHIDVQAKHLQNQHTTLFTRVARDAEHVPRKFVLRAEERLGRGRDARYVRIPS